MAGSSNQITLSENEKKALKLIIEAGEEGLLQQDLWKMLGIDSRDGSRIALRLAKKKLIYRELVTIKGRKTYRLTALVDKIPEEEEEKKEEKSETKYVRRPPRPVRLNVKVSMKLVSTVPCATCPNLQRCAKGQFYDPTKCKKLNQWLQRLAVKLQQKKSAKQESRAVEATA
ncbi:hypothetical protein EYM_05065 [Ignicoccus islandicus DSM 13165]|uniref:B-block binding subunit of TFIIIC domain-containing protein n=1 Tax=Ignicoccus islandicus DSM 13165 TaxID=940295 RepID=A0A0U3E1M3_9CREN|nr:hypothetical protein [Ignicoccus islandicus]ALU11819.1 hypothetical protein EYM_05065 [Ignicoccus islandicus DSM 13165]